MRVLASSEVESYLEQHPVCVLMFGASWCMPCKTLKPRVEKLSEQFEHVPLAYCDAEDHASGLVVELEIMSVPTVVAMVDGVAMILNPFYLAATNGFWGPRGTNHLDGGA
ncbi:MAG: thioredoxin, partial [Proteobacteria bacterium]|nr:thioredoxin [Pseudomonadota bacterium]